MAWCPDCRFEYEEQVLVCTDCGHTLVAGPLPPSPATAPAAGEEWTLLMRVRRPDSAAIIRGLLGSAGIQSEVIDKQMSEIPLALGASTSSLEIWVTKQSAEEARGVLNESREGTAPCPACGHMSSVEEPACEYCGARASSAAGSPT